MCALSVKDADAIDQGTKIFGLIRPENLSEDISNALARLRHFSFPLRLASVALGRDDLLGVAETGQPASMLGRLPTPCRCRNSGRNRPRLHRDPRLNPQLKLKTFRSSQYRF